MPPAYIRMKNATAITYDGETKTPHEWSKDPRVFVHGATIRRRKQSGMTDEQALFSEKVTHNGKTSKRSAPGLREIRAIYKAKLKELNQKGQHA